MQPNPNRAPSRRCRWAPQRTRKGRTMSISSISVSTTFMRNQDCNVTTACGGGEHGDWWRIKEPSRVTKRVGLLTDHGANTSMHRDVMCTHSPIWIFRLQRVTVSNRLSSHISPDVRKIPLSPRKQSRLWHADEGTVSERVDWRGNSLNNLLQQWRLWFTRN